MSHQYFVSSSDLISDVTIFGIDSGTIMPKTGRPRSAMPRHERLHENMLNAQKCRRRKAQEREMLRRLLDFATNCAETSGLPANLSESLEAMRTSWQGVTLMRGQRDTQGSLNAFLEAMGPAMDLAMDPPPPNDGSFGGFDKLTLPELPELDSYSNNEDGGHKEQSIESSESSGRERRL